jgi:hypothetical protein
MGIYERLTDKRKDSKELRGCMEQTIQELLSKNTDVEHPAMLLGDIQSGKTRAFTGIIALGFDKKYDVTVVLTKGTRALVRQTVQRLKIEFHDFEEEDILRIFDIMEMPDDLNEYVVERQKLILVVKKEDDNINRLKKIFFETYQALQTKNILIVDDEADFVSIGYRSRKNEEGTREIDINVISKQISDFRKNLKIGSDYLQVTATPYSLYLQPENIIIRDTVFSPMRPKFTVLLPMHDKYIGSNYYFEESKKVNSPAQYLFQAINEEELKALSKTHGKVLDNVLNSTAVYHFRSAIINYLVASALRILQSEKQGKNNYKSSFIVHTETGKLKHENQAHLVTRLVGGLKVEGKMKSSLLREKVLESYENFKLSISLTNFHLPSFEDTFEKVCEYVRYITIRKINSDNDVLRLLNVATGELRLDSPLNIFIGGQILDRGITVQNLIGFFYGRNPKKMQQDTVMQHARIFGARSLEDMAVTRLYTTNRIYEALRRMHESDKALRKAFEESGPHKNVAFIQKAADGKIIPCNPTKLLISNTVTLRPSGTLPIYGFQTKAKTHIVSLIKKIGDTLKNLSADIEKPFLIPLAIAHELIDKVYETFEDETQVYGSTKEEFKAALEYTSTQTKNQALKGFLYCFSNNKPKNNARFKENQRGKMFNDVCYDGRTDAKKAKDIANDIPCLFLSFQEGSKENDWKDAQFYWPVLFIQTNLITSIFTTDADPDQEIEEDDNTDDTGPLRKPEQQ